MASASSCSATATVAPITSSPGKSEYISGSSQAPNVASVPRQERASAVEAESSTAARVCGFHPRESKSATMSARVAMPISTTTVAAPGASDPNAGAKAVSA